MKSQRFSMKWFRLDSLTKRIIFWGTLTLLASWNYYRDFFELDRAFLLGLLLTAQVVGMVLLGYLWLSKWKKFPRLIFWSVTLAFTLCRFLVVFFVLQYKLPEWTVFHHPDRVGPFLFFTSAAFIFLGYSYAIYEWGIAAREEYQNLMEQPGPKIQSPILIRSEGKTIRLLPQDILYLEAKGEYINYCTAGKNHMYFQRMKHAENKLQDYGFTRAHRSFIVNPIHVRSYSNNEISMSDGKVIPISKTYQEDILERLEIHF